MKSDLERVRLNGVTRDVLGCAFRVANTLGHGFLEKVYENALAFDLVESGHSVAQQKHVEVRYNNRVVGDYCPDMIVDEEVLLEIKALESLEDCHLSQCFNYLRVTGLSVCLLINFGRPRIEYRRIVWNF